jgi:hypothetical protein
MCLASKAVVGFEEEKSFQQIVKLQMILGI